MKNMNKLALLLVLLLTLAFPTVTFAEGIAAGNTPHAVEDKSIDAEEKPENGLKEKPWITEKKLMEQEKNAIEVLKDELEVKMESLELQLQEAEEISDETMISSLKEQLETLKLEKDGFEVQMKERIVKMQQIMRQRYTEEELIQLSEVSKTLNGLANVEAIPVENIFVGNGNLKFDTPPVIKHGRTLIPVRAISEAFGATVQWNAEENTVTITKDIKIIIFNLNENKVYVDNNEIEIDVPAEVMNNRTMVPIRFIAENLGLEVKWDVELQTIEIE